MKIELRIYIFPLNNFIISTNINNLKNKNNNYQRFLYTNILIGLNTRQGSHPGKKAD